MGYNTSRTSVLRSKRDLQALVDAKGRNVRFTTNSTSALAHRLREAIAAAEAHSNEFPEFARLGGIYRFKLRGDHLLAELKEDLNSTIVVEENDVSEDRSTTVKQMEQESDLEIESSFEEEEEEPKVGVSENVPESLIEKKLEFEKAISLIDVLGTILGNLDAHELVFPKAILKNEDKLKLYAWTKEAANSEWKLIDSEENGIVLTKSEVPFEITWQPEEE